MDEAANRFSHQQPNHQNHNYPHVHFRRTHSETIYCALASKLRETKQKIKLSANRRSAAPRRWAQLLDVDGGRAVAAEKNILTLFGALR